MPEKLCAVVAWFRMSCTPITVPSAVILVIAIARLVSGAPVVHVGRPIGMVSAADLLEFIAALPADPEAVSGGLEHGILDDHTVEEAMTRGPLTTISPDAPASRAAELMQAEDVHRLPVVEDGKLVGIITTTDLVKAVADRKLSYRTFVFP